MGVYGVVFCGGVEVGGALAAAVHEDVARR